MSGTVTAGASFPLGVTPDATGVTVAVFSANATHIEFCLFDETGKTEIARIRLPGRTGDIHHGHITGIRHGARYGLRAHGPFDPRAGHRFNPHKLLLDPYAEVIDRRFELLPGLSGHRADDPFSMDETDSASLVPKAIVTARAAPVEPHRLRVPWRDTVIYELNVRGFTMWNEAVPAVLRGTFAGLAHAAAIGHLKSLGVTTIELMPAMAWVDERHLGPLGLTNAWGYNPVTFSAAEPKLAPGGWLEIRKCVDAFHNEGMEVILDVVINHSGEGDELGPTLSFRGLDNASYYRLNPADPARYINDMGCGNCLALERAPVVDLTLHALRTWVRRTGNDGFRFDLATAMGRLPTGFDPHAPLLAAMRTDPELMGLKLIAEAWDIGPGGYQVGKFTGEWGEWNDRYRDTIRRFWRGDSNLIGDTATRLAGSADLFAAKQHPSRSVNFITAHDGFTLADLVSYSAKHNEANGEQNRDGTSDNNSWNHGVEGQTPDPSIKARRHRDQVNLLATLLFSRGTPMLSMGAECGQSQSGNNNAYTESADQSASAPGWFDWVNIDQDLLTATGSLIAIRKDLPLLRDDRFLNGQPVTPENLPDAAWLRLDGTPMRDEDWNTAHADTLILQLSGSTGENERTERLVLVLHRGRDAATGSLPHNRENCHWSSLINTAAGTAEQGAEKSVTGIFSASPHSVLLFSEIETPVLKPIPAPAADRIIDALAQGAGIYADWWDLSGNNHPVTIGSKRAMLTAMGIDVSGHGAARDALQAMATSRQRRALPLTVTAREGQQIVVRLALTTSGTPPRSLTLVDDAGSSRRIACPRNDLNVTEFACLDGRLGRQWQMTLEPLAPGRYRLTRDDVPDATCQLTVAPRRGFLPEGLSRGFGVSAQLYTLRRNSDQGIGDFLTLGEAGAASARSGAATFGINPLHALFPNDRTRASPYSPSDRRFIDPCYVALDGLEWLRSPPEIDALLFELAPRIASLQAERDVDYEGVAALKSTVLRACFKAMREAGGREDFASFITRGGDALRRFAAFRVIEAAHPHRPWQRWPDGLSEAGSRAVARFAAAREEEVGFELFQQWVCDVQFGLAAAKAKAAGLALGFYRDLAVGCAPDGAEAWASQGSFARGVSVGAPPDPFSASGQVWNLPPPNPLGIEADGGNTFRELIAANMRHAGILRIDHVMGLNRLFWVPDGARATEGAYVTYRQDIMLGELALESAQNRCLVVGEDLGTVPEGFREALESSGVLSYRVLWFEREGTGFKPPGHYPATAVACVSTHDLATLAGWWVGTDITEKEQLGLLQQGVVTEERDRRNVEKQVLSQQLLDGGYLESMPDMDTGLSDAFAAAIHAFISATPSLLVFVQADDLAGEAIAVNLPGTDKERPNWRRKLEGPVSGLFTSSRSKSILAAMTKRAKKH